MSAEQVHRGADSAAERARILASEEPHQGPQPGMHAGSTETRPVTREDRAANQRVGPDAKQLST